MRCGAFVIMYVFDQKKNKSVHCKIMTLFVHHFPSNVTLLGGKSTVHGRKKYKVHVTSGQSRPIRGQFYTSPRNLVTGSMAEIKSGEE